MLSDGTFDMIYNVSSYGESGDDGAGISTEKEQYYLSTSNSELAGGEWFYAQPITIPSGRYLFRRWEFTMSDGTKHYSNAIYNQLMEGVINLTDELDQKITQKIWSTDIDTSISAYDNSTVQTIRSQLSEHEQTMDSISDTIQDFQSSVDGDLTTMSNRITTSEQTLDGFMQTVTDQQSTMNGNISDINGNISDINGSIATLNGNVSTLQSSTTSLTQTANDFRFFVQRVADGQASTSTLNITSDGATFVSSNISIKNPNATSTVISGGKISTDLVKSNNYAYSSGNYSTAGTFLNLTDGSIRSKNFAIDASGNAYFKGSVVSSSGEIGGFTIDSSSIHTKNVEITSNASNSLALSSSTFTRTINGTSRGSLKFAIGSNFGVSNTGVLYAGSAIISGTLTAGANSKIGPWNVTATSIYKGNATHGTAGEGNMYFGDNGLSISSTFKVSKAGVLTATGANISGAITATSGSFTGTITARTGEVGGFTIGTNYIKHGSTDCGGGGGIEIASGSNRNITLVTNTNSSSKTKYVRLYGEGIHCGYASSGTAFQKWGDIFYADGYFTIDPLLGTTTATNVIVQSSGNYALKSERGIFCSGDLYVSGTKSRLVQTNDYGDRLLYCYETASPMFGDVGEGVIGEDGYCYVFLDPILVETISTYQYQVFLQKYCLDDIYVYSKSPDHFVVAGTSGTSFGWEIKAKQSDFTQYRLETDYYTTQTDLENYGFQAATYIEELEGGLMA